MNEDHFREMMQLMALDPSETSDEQEDRLAALLELHDSGMAYFDEGSTP